MNLVDAHHHLWKLDAVHYPWLEARGVRRFFGDPTPIQRDYGPTELRADAVGCELLGSVHVQVGAAPGQELAETRWLSQCAERSGLPTVIVAAADLAREDCDVQLDAQRAFPRVRGIRHIVGREPADDRRTGCGRVLDDPRFLEGLRALAQRGLSFDLQLSVPQMPRVADLLERVPELSVALCHCGSPWDRTRRGLASWRSGLERLARLPNLVCKLSGLSMFVPRWTREEFVSLQSVVLDAFGPGRCLFGSNFPVDGLHRRYSEIVLATRLAVEPLGAQALRDVFEGNAREFYRF